MKNQFNTQRLTINLLQDEDQYFILELLNTEGWIKYIGNRNVLSESDALAYIQKINNNPKTSYYTVTITETSDKIGLVTLIQREYLENMDIGFAFLPQFMKQGYAFEATSKLIEVLTLRTKEETLSAVTFPDNLPSIKLLEKLGFNYDKTIENDGMTLNIYNKKLASYTLN